MLQRGRAGKQVLTLTCCKFIMTTLCPDKLLCMQGRSAIVQWTRGQSMGAMCCCCPSSTSQAAWRAVKTLGLKCNVTCRPSRPVLPPRFSLPPSPNPLMLLANGDLCGCPSVLPFYSALLPSVSFPSGCLYCHPVVCGPCVTHRPMLL